MTASEVVMRLDTLAESSSAVRTTCTHGKRKMLPYDVNKRGEETMHVDDRLRGGDETGHAGGVEQRGAHHLHACQGGRYVT